MLNILHLRERLTLPTVSGSSIWVLSFDKDSRECGLREGASEIVSTLRENSCSIESMYIGSEVNFSRSSRPIVAVSPGKYNAKPYSRHSLRLRSPSYTPPPPPLRFVDLHALRRFEVTKSPCPLTIDATSFERVS